MGSAGKQSKWQKQEMRAGNQDSTQAAELVGCAAIMESFSKGLVCVGFGARSLMCLHLSIVTTAVPFGLIKHTEENTVLRRQDGAVTGWRLWIVP